MQLYQPQDLEKIMFNLRYNLVPAAYNPQYTPSDPASSSGLQDSLKETYFKEEYLHNAKSSDQDILDSILKEASGVYRKETIDNLIKKREELKRRMMQELYCQKEKIWDIKFSTLYGRPLPPNMNDLEKLYWMLDQQIVTEEINCWKDVSFLQVKLLEESLAGGIAQENEPRL